MPKTTRDRCITPSFSPSTYHRGKLMDGEGAYTITSHNSILWKEISNSHKVLDRPRKSSHPVRPFLTFRQVSGRVLEYLPPAGCSLGAAIQDVGATAHPRASLEPCTYGLPIGSVALATVIPGLGAAIADPSAVPRSAPAPRQRACCKLWYKPTGCTMDRRFSRSTRTFSIMGVPPNWRRQRRPPCLTSRQRQKFAAGPARSVSLIEQ